MEAAIPAHSAPAEAASAMKSTATASTMAATMGEGIPGWERCQ